MLRVAVVGHVEWITFARVEQVPAAGGIAHASETWTGAGGGGGVAARQLAKLAGSCDLFAAFGEDEVADRAREELVADGVRVYAETRPQATRQAVCLIDPSGERTITTLGPRLQARGSDPLPWDRLGDDRRGLRDRRRRGSDPPSARGPDHGRLTRHRETLAASGVQADAVVGSDRDPAERYQPDLLAHAPPGLVVLTQGADGGRFQTADGGTGRWRPTPPPGPISDTYGSGDSFQAGLTWALGSGLPLAEALDLAARCGAAALTGRGPADGQLTAGDL